MFTRRSPRPELEHGLVVLAALVFLLAACAPSPVTQPDAATPTPPAQVATETPPPATQPPTEAPTETAIPEPELGPEEPALAIEQVAGKWAMRFLGGGGGDAGVLTLAEDGTFSMDATGGEHAGMNLGTGTFRFEAGDLLLESDACLVPGPTDVFFTCTGTYQAFVSMADGKPGRLRLIAVDDPFVDRKKSLDTKSFKPFSEQ